jgi:hypothetical protein
MSPALQVRNGVNPARVFLEQEVQDSVNRTVVKETDVPPPAQPAAASASSYSIWSIDLKDTNRYTIGAEIDGAQFSTIDTHSLTDLAPCEGAKRRRRRRRRRLEHKRKSHGHGGA